MNWFVLVNGAVYLGAAGYSLGNGHKLWALVWLCYAVSAFAMCVMEGK